MDSFKVENKSNILRYKTLFHFIELFIFLVIISRFSTQLPLTFKLCIEYFKALFIILISPIFIFVLGNAIVIILFLIKSCHLSTKEYGSIVNDPKVFRPHLWNYTKFVVTVKDPKDELYKDSICISSGREVERKICRSQSENYTRNLSYAEERPNNRVLRRSATIACRRYGEKPAAEMSSEEFRHTVEAFIARQQRFLREEESSAIVFSEA
uniref:Uncharacterized protein n=3 Tax=Nicotiana TaxID=4085 RepID=A0A1S4DH60_TOBAC|nr:PREDICTED: uncharacterized protein LOC104230372 isoform X1 [Nicotiana sylvestris]XP_016512817.1 PREDICTED: uncharacterized protein LOC107829865 [Nicotiana tabacum]